MLVLVLGGTGFIGPHVVRRLADLGHTVTVYHRGETEVDLPRRVRHVHGDFAELQSRLRELGELLPEVVLDMRPLRREEGRRVLAFADVARRAVVVSSGDVYRAFGRLHRTEPGPPDPVPLSEESPLRETVIDEDYDKVGVEREASSDPRLPVTILRLPATHGPGDPLHRLYPYVRRMDDGRPAIVLEERVARWRWVRGYVENVAAAVALAVADERAAGRIYNVADPVAYTEAEWVRRIAAVHGWDGEIVSVPGERLPEHARSSKFDLRQDFAVDSTRIRHELGYAEPVPEDEALRRTIEWELDNAPVEPAEDDLDYATEDEALAGLPT